MLNNITLSEDEEDASYDVESLFTNNPIKDTIDFICEEMYVHKKLEQICKKSILKKLLTNSHRNVHLVLQENFGNK